MIGFQPIINHLKELVIYNQCNNKNGVGNDYVNVVKLVICIFNTFIRVILIFQVVTLEL